MSLHPQFIDAVAHLYPGVDFRVDVILQDDGAGPYLKAWNLSGEPPTDQEIEAAVTQIPAAQALAKKVVAKDSIDADVPDGKVRRAIADVLIDEMNLVRSWLASFKNEVAAATTLADLKTRVAGLPAMPNRTKVQAIAAIKAAIDADA